MFCQLPNAERCFAVLAHLSGDSCAQMVSRHMWFLVTREDSAGPQPFVLLCFVLCVVTQCFIVQLRLTSILSAGMVGLRHHVQL